MSVKQIMKCKNIVSCVPYPVKADAVLKTLSGEVSNLVPATILKTHPNFTLYIDADSSQKLDIPVLW
jgi:glucosamine-6-phosphate deaminase